MSNATILHSKFGDKYVKDIKGVLDDYILVLPTN